jgi:two-component system, cell cycle sensor histidine kinase and response regulator CckA
VARRGMRRTRIALVLAAALLGLGPGQGLAEPLSLQLKWHHQFQFAGYYAAEAKGFYTAEGLEVRILEGGTERPPIDAVLRGSASFGVGDADVLLARLKGAPLVLCAAIFQHSPYVLLSLRARGIRTPSDLVGARVMLSDDQGAAQLRAMMAREGIDSARVTVVPHSWRLDDLVEGKVDALSAYATVEPALLRARGIDVAMIRSLDYGVDFYGDTLFTTEALVRRQPERVAAFRRASLKGWDYALAHPEELAALIARMPGVAERGVTREVLLREARDMRALILPDVVEIGHMNPGRWKGIADTFVGLGMAPSTKRLEGLVYDAEPSADKALVRRLLWLGLLGLGSLSLALLWNLQMRRSVRDRTRELQEEAVQRRAVEARLSEDVADRTRAEALLLGQKGVLEMIAVGAPLGETLDGLLRVVEAQSPAMLSSILLLDRKAGRVRHAAAPRLPPSFTGAIDGLPIGERAGSCGRAAYLGEPVFVEDILVDPLWDDYRELATAHHLRAAWSTPICDARKRVLGTFALYSREPGRPSERDIRLIDMVTQTASIAITRKSEEEAVRSSEEKFSRAFQSSPDALVLSRLSDGALVEVNEVFLRLSGYSREQALGRTAADLGAWVDPSARDEYLALLRRDGRVRDLPSSFRDASGTTHDGLVSGEILELGSERLALTIIRDVSEINRIQQRLLSIYDTVGDVLFLVALEDDGGFRFESVNKRFAETTGIEMAAVVGKRVEQVIPPDSLPAVLSRYRQAMEQKAVLRWEETTDYPAGQRTGDVSVAPIFDQAGKCTHLVGAVHDLTERKAAEARQVRAEEMLRQSQKLEGIGHLAGGVAHDFNNILNVILGYGELMRSQLGESHAARPRLDQVIQAAQRAAGLTRQLLAFSRKQVLQPKLLDLGAVVGDMRPMLERVIGEDLEFMVRSADELGAVLADPTQVEQVIMNLVVNARDAMPTHGCLTIETANVEFDAVYAAAHPPAKAGAFVMLAVSDTGSGMDAETQKRLFEPFFTTKPAGEGTGLGLSTVYGIVKQTGGYVWVYSEVGRGTTFKIYLPRVEEARAEEKTVLVAPVLPRGTETVLVVEDTESLRDLIRELLEEQGYTVLVARDGEEALALAAERAAGIDLLLTDVVMPKLGGGDLAQRMRASRPRIRVLFMSGYTSGAISRHGALQEGANLLEKPFTAEQLARAVRLALSAGLV